jgi:DNA-directed RNA polymerase specialized sigma24 family protein
MDKNELDDFFAKQPITFSEQWKKKLMNKLEKLKEEEKTGRYVSKHHNALIQEMQEEGKRYFCKKFPKYDIEDVEDMVQDTYIEWSKKFDATKSVNSKFPELNFFLLKLRNTHSKWYKKQNLKTSTNITQFDKDGYPILDELGKEIFEDEKLSNENEEERTRLVSIGGKQFSKDACNELYKYYLLSDRMPKTHNRNTIPQPTPISKTIKKDKFYQNKPEFDNMSDASVAALNNLQYLKNAKKHN